MSTVSTRPPGLLRGWRLTTYLETPRAGRTLSPGSPLLRVGCYTRNSHNRNTFFTRAKQSRPPRRGGSGAKPARTRAAATPRPAAERGERGPQRARVAVRDLEREAGPVGRRAHSSPSAPPLATVPGCACISTVSVAPSPPTSSGCARIAAATRSPPSSDSSRAKAAAARSSGIAKATTPQPSMPVAISSRVELRRCRDFVEQQLLQRVVWRAGSPRPASRARGRRRACPACLPEQLCVDRLRRAALLDAAVELVLAAAGRGRAACRTASTCSGRAVVRGGGDRELLVGRAPA